MTSFDAILVPGGGVRLGGVLPDSIQERFDLAITRSTSETIVCLSAGTTHRPPPIDADGFPILESFAGARYLMSKGIPVERIQVEATSYDTVGNAYFSKVLHVDPAGWRKLLVITSSFHMPRTQAIFEWVYGLEPGKYELSFAASPDRIDDPRNAESRREHERVRLEAFRKNTAGIKTVRELHHWLYTEHRAYTPDRRFLADRSTDPALLDSY